MGDEISDYKRFSIPRPKEADGALKGAVLRADAFGNLITNFRSEDLPESALNGGAINLQVGSHQVSRLVDTFARGNNGEQRDRKSTRLNSSHMSSSYAVFCLKKKTATRHGGGA